MGPVAFGRLLERGSPQHVRELSVAELRGLGLSAASAEAVRKPDWDAVEHDLAWLDQPAHHLLRRVDAAYPQALLDLPDPPPLLFVQGDPDVLNLPQLAVVGSRNASHAGAEIAHDFARELAAAGITITSGLARGIDAAAHRGALAARGLTVAVTGTGPDRVYPASHRRLAHAIAEEGAIVTEFPPGTGVRPENFPRRNRIISGLSLGTLVVEASLRSGSRITARSALEQGREVFAIPGSIHNPLSKGCHALIREGAKLVETVGDILEELQVPTALPATAPVGSDGESEEMPDKDYLRLLEALDSEPTPLEVLLQRTGLTPAEVSSMLLVLELRGWVSALAGGRYRRTSACPNPSRP